MSSLSAEFPTQALPVGLPTTTHRVRWGEHVDLVKAWRKRPPTHPDNPRYRAYDIRVEGRYSLFETIVNVFRDKGWLDPPPPEYKWADVIVSYRAEDDPRDEFSRL
ncbi:hypothetical protein [Tautonia plasticadhaerens]|uniref:Uncharacterized protein n=1 Tax=Tautonia plasticadhaerens TaxID=2527974 RepID=A0A518H579_9BACT|nr:hypothetical protein [Tautonia plasticadhaerens]QDV35997.1 hypothetical protein ElP_39070 [Tautonia plasticadhaerens]